MHSIRFLRALASGALIGLLVLPAVLAAQAEPPLDPDRAVALALQHSPDVAAARAAVRAAEADLRQAAAIANPTLSWQYERTAAGSNINAQHITTLEQPLAFGQRGARRDVATARRAAAVAALRRAELDLAMRVARAYAAAAAAERQVEIAVKGERAFGRAVTMLEARLAAGDVSGYELRRTRLESARLSARRAALEVSLRNARRELAALLAPPGAPGALAPSPLRLPRVVGTRDAARPAVSGSDTLLDARPDMIAAQARSEEAEAAARLAAWERIPVPTLIGGYKTERAAGLGSLSGIAAGLTMPLPVFDRRSGATDAARAVAVAATESESAVATRARLEIAAAADALHSANVQLDALAPVLGEEADRALAAAQLAYAEGEIALDAWLLALRAFGDAEDAYTVVLADAFILYAEHAIALGRLPSWDLP